MFFDDFPSDETDAESDASDESPPSDVPENISSQEKRVRGGDREGLRRGKWTNEEQAYAARLIHDFEAGILPLKNGTTLRAFLAKKLNCGPMRISKKFAGNQSIGKQIFVSSSPEGTAVHRDEDGLRLLEADFQRSVAAAASARGCKRGPAKKPATSSGGHAVQEEENDDDDEEEIPRPRGKGGKEKIIIRNDLTTRLGDSVEFSRPTGLNSEKGFRMTRVEGFSRWSREDHYDVPSSATLGLCETAPKLTCPACPYKGPLFNSPAEPFLHMGFEHFQEETQSTAAAAAAVPGTTSAPAPNPAQIPGAQAAALHSYALAENWI